MLATNLITMTPKKKGKKQSGGPRPGAGRKYKGVPTEKIRLNESVRDALKNHVDWLIETGGKFISQQTFGSNAILNCAERINKDPEFLQELINDLAPSPAPWTTVSITQEAKESLSAIVLAIDPHTPVYTNLSNVFTVILLKEIKRQTQTLS